MGHRNYCTVLTVAVLPGVAQTVNMRPGRYETTAKIDLAGMKMEPQKEVEDDLRMTGVTEMTFASESFSAIMTMKDNKGRVTKIETTAKRIGECAK